MDARGAHVSMFSYESKVYPYFWTQGTRSIQGIVLDFKEGISKKKNSSAGTNFWGNHERRLSLIPAVTYLKERYKKRYQHGSENERETILSTKSFKSMVSLRLLQINHIKLEGKFKFLPAELKWLQWKKCTVKTLPSDFCPVQLAVLDLSNSAIEHVWGSYTNKVAKNLMVMNLRGCWNLAAIPDLSKHQILEKLVLEGCIKLTKIHESLGNMSTLLHLNLRACSSLIEFPSDVSGLKHLEKLILSRSSELKNLPENLGCMRSLKELLLDGTAIEKLPNSIFYLVKLEKLNLDNCKLLKQLPECIGKLNALNELSLNHSAIEELPDSVGYLGNLQQLSLIGCRLVTAIPYSIGNLKSLIEFLIGGTAVKELPTSIGSLSYLKTFSVWKCQLLCKLPESIEGLASLVELELDGTSIKDLPDQIGGLKMLDKLRMKNCKYLKNLPVSIGRVLSLTTLDISEANILELPESIGMLENLILLRMNKCKQLQKLPASIGQLKSLVHLLMEETAITELPESFGMLSSLMVLRMAKKPPLKMPGKSEPMMTNVVLPASFTNLTLLEELDARSCRICGKIPDDFDKLSRLEILRLDNNNFHSLPSSMRGLSFLKKLWLCECEELKFLPPLPSSLEEINVADCFELERIHDLSNLESLKLLNLTNCEKVMDIPGLECLKSLRRLHMSCCNACSAVVKKRLSKVHLKKLRYLSMPGSKLPEWFTPNIVRFSKRKNLEIKAVIIGVVIALDHQIPDDVRCQLPGVVDIRATITTPDKPIFYTTLDLRGVPKTNDDQVHFCRYSVYGDSLVMMLKDGYKIQVSKRDPPVDKGVELKKCGIYLVYENDDDYDGDENSLEESQLSVSEKLVHFFASFGEDEDDQMSEAGTQVEQEMQEIKEQEGTQVEQEMQEIKEKEGTQVEQEMQEIKEKEGTNSSNNDSYFTFVTIVVSFTIMLISWSYFFVLREKGV
ncbi:hypothetical protein Pint_23113 [Pistacia integerrima]|uniref:Uncharacterized protein n=1 Tax=Pistacia integerrima TaxID=434235 RepID=A0ACC0YG83_9ROSI|nr:hypothetical protein Pint_23113 [Pistacia integerrima]